MAQNSGFPQCSFRQSEQYEALMSFTELIRNGHGVLAIPPAYPHPHPPHSAYPYGHSYPAPVTSPISSRPLPPIQSSRHHVSEQSSGSRHPIRPPALQYPAGPPPPHGPPGTLPPPPPGAPSYPPRRDSGSLLERPYNRRGSDYMGPRSHVPPHPQQQPQHGQPGEKRRRRSTSQDSVDVDEMLLQTASSPRNPYPIGSITVPRKRTYEEYGSARGPQPPGHGEPRNVSGSGSFSESPKRRKFTGSEIDLTTAGHGYGRSPPSAALGSAQVMTSPQTAHVMPPPSAGVPTATPTQTTTSTGQVIQAYPPQNPEGQRICRQCGMPGRYKEGKCVEKWGPGPLGPGTVCDRCRKRMRRVERKGTHDQTGDPGSALPSAGPVRTNSKPDLHTPHHSNSLPNDDQRGVPRSGTLPSMPFVSQQRDDRRIASSSFKQSPPPINDHGTDLDQDADADEDAEGEDVDPDADGEIEAEIAGTIGPHPPPTPPAPEPASLPQTIHREDYARLQPPLADSPEGPARHPGSPTSEENSASSSSRRSPVLPIAAATSAGQNHEVLDEEDAEFMRAVDAAEERSSGGL
ncbi:hypothetical protein DL96DRAFT_240623 [Flagelloscypha sp. PMI_526]|nr:hypothetical protein DL96DRAFT_240623 [Flagelloscypha sp. PMI_526]